MIDRKFPKSRLRRLRRSSNLINLVSENTLSANDLIQPLFIKEGLDGSEPIDSMPNINRYGLKDILKEIEDVLHNGINTIALFPVINPDKKKFFNKYNNDVSFIYQKNPLGTGHAVIQAKKLIEKYNKVFVFVGDSPFITSSIIKDFPAIAPDLK